jgi:predicted RecB family nuclease
MENGTPPETLDVIGRLPNRSNQRCGDFWVKTVDGVKPTYSNGLKDVARRLGFEWSESEASGRQALIWRAQWETTRDPTLKAASI